MSHQLEQVEVQGAKINVMRKGTGEPLLYLHGADGAGEWTAFFELLSAQYEVYVPEHPGFGNSDDPDWLEDISDLVLFYKDFLDLYQFKKVHLVGHALGGWLAAEFATQFSERVLSLTLIDAAGIHVDGVEIGDNFLWHPDEQARNLFYNQELAQEQINRNLSQEELVIEVKNRTTTAKLVWTPRYYNPKLKKRLYRIKAPSLIVWGQEDHLFPVEHAYAYQKLISSSSITIIPKCGHSPQLEKPNELFAVIQTFANTKN